MLIGLARRRGRATSRCSVRDRTSPAVLLGVLGLALPALIVHQLARGVVRVRVTESLAGVAVLVAAEVALAALLALGPGRGRQPAGRHGRAGRRRRAGRRPG